ncbi:MAG: DNA-binding response regulator [Ignavibacteriae bacterium HGW-Ignavibacteriae-3]|nr:MAG: DNA-binding response regulator [Ignavibacteriae bacterium HGW-Ignavibacteriae-3]
MKTKILLVDDEKDIVEFLSYNLIREGFDVITAHDGKDAIEKLIQKPDLIILDVLMPKMDGYQVCVSIRNIEEFKNTPVMFLTAKGSEIDEVHGLSLGADDYIQKPISPKKLIARVKSNLRKIEAAHSNSGQESEIKIGQLVINREKYTVTLGGNIIILPKKEFEILNYLASNPGKVFQRERILKDVWGEDIYVIERTVDVHVRKIREKFGSHSDLIETIKGVGYRFKNIE